MTVRLLMLTGAIMLVVASASAEPIDKGEIHISDGDTIFARGRVFRLVGFNTPETFKARYAEERALGVKAHRRLQQLVDGGGLDLTEVRCSCRPGTEGTRECNFGRACGVLKAKGVDVGRTLISEGLVRRANLVGAIGRVEHRIDRLK
jgi:endonuclease YncB( thermonuclease family)